MNLSDRDRKLLGIWAVLLVAGGVYYFSGNEPAEAKLPSTSDTVPAAERRLARTRQLASMVPGRTALNNRARQELATREKGMLQADTAPQAQAQLFDLLQKLTRSENVELRSKELGQVRQFGDSYGEVTASISFETTIDATLNLLTKLTQQPELLATEELRITAGNAKQKTVQVRLTVAAIVPRKLVPEKKGLAAF
jgi:hypothetical protein